MSWDLFIYDFPKNAKTPSDIPTDWKPSSIGTLSEVTAKIKEAAPGASFSVPHWGVIGGKGYSIEVNLGTNDTLTSVVLYVHGGEGSVEAVSAIISRLGLRAIDSGTGGFFEPGAKALAGYSHAAEYTKQVVSKHGSSNKPLQPTAALVYVLFAFGVVFALAALWRLRRRLWLR